MTTRQEFAAERKRVREIENTHPDPVVRNHAQVLWNAMEGALPDPDKAPAPVKAAIQKATERLAKRIAEYEAHKAGKGD